VTTNTSIGNNGTTVSPTLLDTMNGASSTSSTSGTSASDLQNTFLTLLVTQLQNQDPTNPADSSQMTSQLAEINTVSGIGQLNTSLTSLATQLSAGQTAQAALLIGSTVLAPGSTMTVTSGAASNFAVGVAADVSDLKVVVKNSAGAIVNTIDAGAQSAGTVSFAGWTPVDSSGNKLPDGNYTFTATGVATADGSTVNETALAASKVVGVVQQGSGTQLALANGATVALGSVVTVQ
jgi:flagellar basal-body rod modification protein FlgD